MADEMKLNDPWLVAVWPGMGNVALNAGVYLLAKLGMTAIAEFEAGDLFDIEHLEVKEGLIQTPRRPRNRFFGWKDPNSKRDLLLFVGEAQPPLGKYRLCRQIIDYARGLGAQRVITFAAMATEMRPESVSRIFAAATDEEGLSELKQLEMEVLKDGHIGGLNGVLLGAAAEAKMRGACLLGEMPHIFNQLPFPKASLAILEIFTTLSGLELDLGELADLARDSEQQLGRLLARVEREFRRQQGGGEEEEYEPDIAEVVEEEEPTSPADRDRIETLFEEAEKDHTKAFELKQELDRLSLFKEYEDRFLDLFKKPE